MTTILLCTYVGGVIATSTMVFITMIDEGGPLYGDNRVAIACTLGWPIILVFAVVLCVALGFVALTERMRDVWTRRVTRP